VTIKDDYLVGGAGALPAARPICATPRPRHGHPTPAAAVKLIAAVGISPGNVCSFARRAELLCKAIQAGQGCRRFLIAALLWALEPRPVHYAGRGHLVVNCRDARPVRERSGDPVRSGLLGTWKWLVPGGPRTGPAAV
jgi:hypothetical protein